MACHRLRDSSLVLFCLFCFCFFVGFVVVVFFFGGGGVNLFLLLFLVIGTVPGLTFIILFL